MLARQKEMQLSLDKVKHLIRLIQAFNFNQALAETEGKDARVQNSAQGAVGSETAPETNSVEKVKAGHSSVSSTQEEHQPAGVVGGDANSQPDITVPVADNCPGAGMGVKVVPGFGTGARGHSQTSLQVEAETKPETDTAVVGDVSTSVATTNGMAEPTCPDHGPAGVCAANNNSENKIVIINPTEPAVENKQEEITDGNGNNTNNSKTSEPSQHSLPAFVSSLDNKK